MVLIFLKSGDCIEMPKATSAIVGDGYLTCFDAQGENLQQFDSLLVESYTANLETALSLASEVCDDIAVIGGQSVLRHVRHS